MGIVPEDTFRLPGFKIFYTSPDNSSIILSREDSGPAGQDAGTEEGRGHRALRTLTTATGIIAIAIGFLGLTGLALEIPFFSSILPGYKTIGVFTAASLIFLGALFVLVGTRRLRGIPADVARGLLGILALVEAMGIFTSIAGTNSVFENAALEVGYLLFHHQTTPSSLVASFTIILLAVAMIPVIKRDGLPPREPYASAAGILGLVVALLSFTFLMSDAFGTPVLYNVSIVSPPIPAVIGTFMLGIGTVAAAGTNGLPLKNFSGTTIRARLLRAYVPSAIVLTMCVYLFVMVISDIYNVTDAFLISTCIVFVGLATGVVTSWFSNRVGSELDRTEETLHQTERALRGINEILDATISSETEEDLGMKCLEIAERLTDSEIGFVGEVNGYGFQDIAISNPGWDACRGITAGGHRRPPGNLKIHGIYGRVLKDGKGFFTNTPAHHPDHIGLPHGHPPLWSFLGVPLKREGVVTGMIAVGNKPGGYTREDLLALETLAPAIVEAFTRKRAEDARKDAQDQISHDRKRLESILGATPSAVVIVDKSTRKFSYLNQRARTLYGVDYLGSTLPDHIERVRPLKNDGSPYPLEEMPVSISLESGREVHNEEMIIERADGTQIPVIVSSAPLFDVNGNIDSVIVAFDDITQRKQAEEELVRKNTDLEAANEKIYSTQDTLQAKLEELSIREEEIRKALEEKEVLLSEIHHRVKNNLTAFISLISLEGSTEDSPAGKVLKLDLQNRARSMALIHETLYKTHKFDRVDLGMYLSTLVDQIAHSLGSKKPVKTVVDAGGIVLDLPRATPLGLIVNELVTNSFKYAFPDSFDTVAIRQAPPTIAITVTKVEGEYVVVVSDNGVGLPTGFDVTKSQTLGLKLVNFLSRHQLKADLEVRSVNGAEFIFRFKEHD